MIFAADGQIVVDAVCVVTQCWFGNLGYIGNKIAENLNSLSLPLKFATGWISSLHEHLFIFTSDKSVFLEFGWNSRRPIDTFLFRIWFRRSNVVRALNCQPCCRPKDWKNGETPSFLLHFSSYFWGKSFPTFPDHSGMTAEISRFFFWNHDCLTPSWKLDTDCEPSFREQFPKWSGRKTHAHANQNSITTSNVSITTFSFNSEFLTVQSVDRGWEYQQRGPQQLLSVERALNRQPGSHEDPWNVRRTIAVQYKNHHQGLWINLYFLKSPWIYGPRDLKQTAFHHFIWNFPEIQQRRSIDTSSRPWLQLLVKPHSHFSSKLHFRWSNSSTGAGRNPCLGSPNSSSMPSEQWAVNLIPTRESRWIPKHSPLNEATTLNASGQKLLFLETCHCLILMDSGCHSKSSFRGQVSVLYREDEIQLKSLGLVNRVIIQFQSMTVQSMNSRSRPPHGITKTNSACRKGVEEFSSRWQEKQGKSPPEDFLRNCSLKSIKFVI